MKKREKFLLAFFIAVVILVIYNMYMCNIYLNGYKQLLLDATNIDEYLETINVAIYATEIQIDMLFNFICELIILTTVIYLMLIIKIENFKGYLKDLFKAFLIILIAFLFIEIISLVRYANIESITFVAFKMFIQVFLVWCVLVVLNLIMNYKKLKFNRNNK